MINDKIYKPKIITIISNPWIVNMLPGDLNGLPDVFYTNFSLRKYGGNFLWKIL